MWNSCVFHTITVPITALPRPAHSCQNASGEEAQSGRSMSTETPHSARKTKSVRDQNLSKKEGEDGVVVGFFFFYIQTERQKMREERQKCPSSSGRRAGLSRFSPAGEREVRTGLFDSVCSASSLRHLPKKLQALKSSGRSGFMFPLNPEKRTPVLHLHQPKHTDFFSSFSGVMIR